MRVGLVLSPGLEDPGASRLLDWCATHLEIDLHLFKAPEVGSPLGLGRTVRRRGDFALSMLLWVEAHVQRRQPDAKRAAHQTTTLSEVMQGPHYGCAAWEAATAAVLGEAELDLIVLLHPGLDERSLVGLARLGVLAYGEREYLLRFGSTCGLDAVVQQSPGTRFSIVWVNGQGANLVFRGQSTTRVVWSRNRDRLLTRRAAHMQRCIEEAVAGRLQCRGLPIHEDSDDFYPTLRQMCRYLGFLLSRGFGSITRRLTRRTRNWHVLFESGDWRADVLQYGREIESRDGHLLADPFVASEVGASYVFAEDMGPSDAVASVSAYQLGPDGASWLGTVLREPFHLSFPYVFEFDGRFFMCPETSQISEIRLYAAHLFPLGWKYAATLMSEVSAADSLLFEFGGRWWLFTNIDIAAAGDHSSELYAYFADSPLSTNWRPHVLNPLVSDPLLARNGGLIRDEHGVLRVAQVQGFGTYGYARSIRRIVLLTPDEFLETEVARQEPDANRGEYATHQLHSDGNFTVVDYFGVRRSSTTESTKSRNRR